MRILTPIALVFCISVSSSAGAQSLSEMAGKTFADSYSVNDQELVNAAKAVEEGVKSFLTKGESTRGASGALSGLLIEADTIMCASWLFAADQAMKELAGKGALSTPEGADLFNSLWRLKNRIEAACQRVLNNTQPPSGNGGGGQDDSTPGGDDPCPDCPASQLAVDIAQYRLDKAEHELKRLEANTDFAYELAATRPDLYRVYFPASTPQELEAQAERKAVERDRAQRILDQAKRQLEACKKACEQKKTAFFDSNRNKLLVAAAAVGVTTMAMMGGGGTPTTVNATPSSPPVSQSPNNPPVVSNPTPTPVQTLLQLIIGGWVCAACRVLEDRDRHENTLRFCAQLVALFQLLANSPLRIEHPAPWVNVSGELNETTGEYLATGMGSVAGFSGVSSRVQATFQRTGDTVSSVELTVTLGENGVFPGGRPVSYAVRLTKRP